MSNSPFIQLIDIKKSFITPKVRTDVLMGVNLSINKGEYLSIMAPSGMGKTTLMHIIGLLDLPTTGKYLLNNKNVSHLNDNQLSLLRNTVFGFVFQQFFLIEQATVMDNVLLPTMYYKGSKKDFSHRAQYLLEKLNLQDRMYYKANELSGGQKQRVAIVRALINDAQCLLADEPTGNLDTASSLEVMDIFDNIHSLGTTIVMVTHDMQMAKRSDRIIEMKDGVISNIIESTISS